MISTTSSKPRVMIDARAIDFLPYGVGRYARELVARLPILKPDWEWIILRHGPVEERQEQQILRIQHPMPFDDYPSEQCAWEELFSRYRPNLIHSLWFHTAEVADCLRLLTLQDTILLKGYRDYRNALFLGRQPWYYRSLEAADALIVSSLNTFRDVTAMIQYPPNRIRFIPLACSETFKATHQKAVDQVRMKLKLPATYFYVSAHYRNSYKNLQTALTALHILEEDGSVVPPIVTTGYAPGLPFENTIHLGFIAEEDLAAVLAGATALIYPSHDEGFGLPLLEAMACRTPVICSHAGSLPEVGGDSVLYFNPSNPYELADSIRTLLHHPSLRNHLVAKGMERLQDFSWDKTASETIDYYQQLLNEPPKPRTQRNSQFDWERLATSQQLPLASSYPRFRGHFLQLATSALKSGNVSEAQELLDIENQWHPGHPDTLRELGKLAKARNDWEPAAEYFQQMRRVAKKLQDPAHLRSACFHLGESLIKLSRFEEARQALQQCLSVCPDHQQAPLLLREIESLLSNGSSPLQGVTA